MKIKIYMAAILTIFITPLCLADTTTSLTAAHTNIAKLIQGQKEQLQLQAQLKRSLQDAVQRAKYLEAENEQLEQQKVSQEELTKLEKINEVLRRELADCERVTRKPGPEHIEMTEEFVSQEQPQERYEFGQTQPAQTRKKPFSPPLPEAPDLQPSQEPTPLEYIEFEEE